MHSVMKPSMGMSIDSQMSQHDNADRRMDMSRQMSNVRDMYRDNQDMTNNLMNRNRMGQDMMDRNMMGQERRSDMRDMQRPNQAFTPNQYMVKDDFGNYAYSYNGQESEKSEERNGQSIKGQYTYIMANGVKRRVEYIADNNGFHIIRDNADPARIKRSTEPDFIQTRMQSLMGSSSLRDDANDMYRMSSIMGLDMPSNMDRNPMGIEQQRNFEQQRYTNMMGRDSFNRNMMGQDTMGHEMMGRNIYNIMSNRGMTSDVSNMIGQQMNSNMMGQDMTMMSRNMMAQDRNSQMMDMSNNRMSNMMNSREMSSDSLVNNGLMGQRMMQKMEIEHVPETYTSTRFF